MKGLLRPLAVLALLSAAILPTLTESPAQAGAPAPSSVANPVQPFVDNQTLAGAVMLVD